MLPQEATRTIETIRIYALEGQRHRRRAANSYPEIACPVDALVRSFEQDAAILRPRTVRRYRQETAMALSAMVDEDLNRASIARAAQDRIEAALMKRKGKPLVPRTSTKQVRDPTQAECICVLADLVERADRVDGTGLAGLIPDFVRVAPHLGLRPTEWIGANLSGSALTVRCAKTTNGRGCGSHRTLELGQYPPDFIAAVGRLVVSMPEMLVTYGTWEGLRGAMAERLARSCERVAVRRLALYSFRHCALATWKAAGLAPVEIAALAGHKTVAMQKSYASSRHGWKNVAGLPQADAALVSAIATRSAVALTPTSITQSETVASSPTGESHGGRDRAQDAPATGASPVNLDPSDVVQALPPDAFAMPVARPARDETESAAAVGLRNWQSYKARQEILAQQLLRDLHRQRYPGPDGNDHKHRVNEFISRAAKGLLEDRESGESPIEEAADPPEGPQGPTRGR